MAMDVANMNEVYYEYHCGLTWCSDQCGIFCANEASVVAKCGSLGMDCGCPGGCLDFHVCGYIKVEHRGHFAHRCKLTVSRFPEVKEYDAERTPLLRE